MNFDIISINETMLDYTISDYEISVPGYDLVRKDRHRNGGGVVLFIRDSINFKIREDLMMDSLELLSVEIFKPKVKSFIISTWYRPPNASIEIFDDFELCIKKWTPKTETIFIGDFNCDWSLPLEKRHSHTNKLADITNMYQLEQIIKETKRVTQNTKSLIDLIFSNKPELIIKSGVEHVGISDHSLIYMHRKISIPCAPPKIVKTRQYKYYNKQLFKSDLREIFNNNVYQTEDPNELWNDWKTRFLIVADEHAPPITRKVRSEYSPWLTSNITKQMRHRDYLKKQAVRTGSPHFHQAYKRARNFTNKIIKKTKTSYYMESFEKTSKNPKAMWNTINKLLNKKSKTTNVTELTINDESITDKKKIANKFNEYYSNIGAKLADKIPESVTPPESYMHQQSTEFSFDELNENDVLMVLRNIKSSKSTGHDRIPPNLVKDAAEVISSSLTKIFNQSMNTGIFPDDLKIAIVSPVYKTGAKNDCGNYRPISVLSVIAKVFERIIYQQLYTYLQDNNILSPQQAGFRKNHSTQTSLLCATNNWFVNMDKGLLNGVIFLDLKKAFDCVDHEILVRKLSVYGLHGLTLEWFISYLSNRSQICKISQAVSQQHAIKYGVPQGSNLGPLLFLIYINDLPNCLENVSTSMFADDTSLSSIGKNKEELEECLNNTLEKVHQWLCSNKLTLSRDKTEYMIIASRQRLNNINSDPLIKLGNDDIKRVRRSKTLGVIVDDKLLWNEHIDNITTKASKGLAMLRRMKPFVPRSILITIYKSLILPYLDYCCLVWDNCSNYLLDNLQKIQNRAARIITGKSYEIRSRDLLRELNWPDLKERRSQQKAMLMFKIKNEQAAQSIVELFSVTNNETHELRSNNKNFLTEKPKTNFLKKSFGYSGASHWNNLPASCKTEGISMQQFRALLRDEAANR